MTLMTVAMEAASTAAGATPYWVGGTALVSLCGAMFALIALGNGRDHS